MASSASMATQSQQDEPLPVCFTRKIVPDSDLTIRLEWSENDGPRLSVEGKLNVAHVDTSINKNADLPMPAEFQVKKSVLIKRSKYLRSFSPAASKKRQRMW